MKRLICVLLGWMMILGCGKKESGIPTDPCERLKHCAIDESCDKDGYKTCGAEADCTAVTTCIHALQAQNPQPAAKPAKAPASAKTPANTRPPHKAVSWEESCRKENKDLCEKQWPRSAKSSARTTYICSVYWVFNYGYGQAPDKELLEFDVNRSQLKYCLKTLTPDEVQRVLGRLPLDNPEDWIRNRANEFFSNCANETTSLTGVGLDDLPYTDLRNFIATIFAGKELQKKDICFLGDVGLWKLRNAVYARHGYKFKNDHLNQLFYGPRTDDRKAAAVGLPAKRNPAFSKDGFSAADRANIALIRGLETDPKRADGPCGD